MVVLDGRGAPCSDWLGASRTGVPSGVVWLAAGPVWGAGGRGSPVKENLRPPRGEPPVVPVCYDARAVVGAVGWAAAQAASYSAGGMLSQAE